ncbi:MAG: DUF1778 domain-containing protein [Moraxellaceae bacterium]|jgi:uncharacterized protein (DUF1778 family)|nr:DUF1778 domain-containing protein [Moraxellaceae bacterium]
MTTARLDFRIDDAIKLKAEKAASLLGLKSLTEYVVKLMDENASKVIAEHESITLKDDIFTQFMAACDQAKEPNDALKAALKLSRDQGFNNAR